MPRSIPHTTDAPQAGRDRVRWLPSRDPGPAEQPVPYVALDLIPAPHDNPAKKEERHD
ncbi:hypothetical protein [Amycolatopsis pigmentata]|uniref:Uncharacterized protein n=1 Tax=Amycolatopsis pigmentata TaxID=450801 RepID=A0ABW5G932_9PSEU